MATPKAKKVQFLGTGRRKESVARVRLLPNGKGQITVNKLPYDEYFKLETLKLVALQPLTLTNTREKYDIFVNNYKKLCPKIVDNMVKFYIKFINGHNCKLFCQEYLQNIDKLTFLCGCQLPC